MKMFQIFEEFFSKASQTNFDTYFPLKIFWIGPLLDCQLQAINTFSLELGVVIKLFWVN